MSTARVVWMLIGVGYVTAGLITLLHRGFRERTARGGASFHRAVARRAPWLYGPRSMREWMLGERVWRAITIFGAVLFIAIGLMAIFGVGVD